MECRFVSINAVRSLLETFTTVTTKEAVAEMIDSMDLFDLHDINLEEFLEVVSTIFQDKCTEEIDQCLAVTLQAYFLSTKDTAQQVRFLPSSTA
jgi:Ca2+-binding EF-hand superfamily protein